MGQRRYCIYFCNNLAADKKDIESHFQDMHHDMTRNHKNSWPGKSYDSLIENSHGFADGMKSINKKIEETVSDTTNNPTEGILVFNSLTDICPESPARSLQILYILYFFGFEIFITSVSLRLPFSNYCNALLNQYHIFSHKPGSKYSKDLLEYAADIRISQSWSYKTITEKTGINRTTLIEYLKREDETGCLGHEYVGQNESEEKKFGKEEEYTILFLKCGMRKNSAKKWAEIAYEKMQQVEGK